MGPEEVPPAAGEGAGRGGRAEGPGSPDVPQQCLTFLLAAEEYAVDILRIRRVVACGTLTPVPETPPWMRGVMELSGAVVPVIDLAARFFRTETEVTARTCVVVVEAQLAGTSVAMGIIVDAVSRVLDLALREIDEPPAAGPRVPADYLLGAGRAAGRLVPVLDLDRVLGTDGPAEASGTADRAGEGEPATAAGGTLSGSPRAARPPADFGR